ncbi:hypothetical protein ROTAS13_01633 [Roseomonas sp. TAS13]|nr:hypothetical protein ROTAS13_01633 [Roseomonas sp. TAS13]
MGQGAERDGIGRDGAAIRATPRRVQRGTGHVLQRRLHLLLHLVSGADIARHIHPQGTGGADEAGMLAGAVVVQGRRLGAGARQVPRRLGIAGPVRAAFQAARLLPGLAQHGGGGLGMQRLAGMGGAGERQLRFRQAEAIGRAALDQRQGLDHLHRRARENGPLHIAGGEDEPALRIHHREGPRMARFHLGTARDFHQNRIFHACFLPRDGPGIQGRRLPVPGVCPAFPGRGIRPLTCRPGGSPCGW